LFIINESAVNANACNSRTNKRKALEKRKINGSRSRWHFLQHSGKRFM